MSKSLLLLFVPALMLCQTAPTFSLRQAGTYRTGILNGGAAEIVAHDPQTQRLFVVNLSGPSIDILNIAQPAAPVLLRSIPIPSQFGASANSVAVRDGVLAVAIQATVKTDAGYVAFFNTDGVLLGGVRVGALPDMLTFTPDGTKILVANEGEPNDTYTVDPEGTVSIIDVRGGAANVRQSNVTEVRFTQFNAPGALPANVRVYGPRATPAQDFEPEYIAVSADSRTAYVSLQEANTIAVIDIATATVSRLLPLGYKNHALAANALDPSDRDNGIRFGNYPVLGMYQPDAIATFQRDGQTYLITANEGDTRDYPGYREERRVSEVTLDPVSFPNAAALRTDAQLGRLTISIANADIDGDGDIDRLYLPGGRSFTIWTTDGQLVWDSGDQFERITAERLPQFFNSNGDDVSTFDTRSDNKGPEPEAVTVGEVNGRLYAFIALERTGGIMTYDISTPSAPRFVDYINNRTFGAPITNPNAGDIGPEGLIFIPAASSPAQAPTLVVASEVSGSTTLYTITAPTAPISLTVTPDALTTASDQIVLDASASTGQNLTFTWRSLGKSASISPREGNAARVTVSLSEGYGQYIFEVTARDSSGYTASRQVRVFLAGSNEY